MPLLLFALLLCVPGTALANVGLPMLAIAWPVSSGAFIPVVAIESWLVHRDLSIPWKTAAVRMAKANIWSTVFGIPIAWFVLAVFEVLITWQVMAGFDLYSYPRSGWFDLLTVIVNAPWLGDPREGAYWAIPVAMMTLLLPFFYCSYWIESGYVVAKFSPDEPIEVRKVIRKAIWKANLTTYLMLFLACLGVLIYGLIEHA